MVRRWDCIAGSYEDQFETEPDSTPLSPYDFGSYMHYQTGLRCPIPTPAGCTLPFDKDDDGVDEMYCDTMHRKEGGAAVGGGFVADTFDFGSNDGVYHGNYFVQPAFVDRLELWLLQHAQAAGAEPPEDSGPEPSHGHKAKPPTRGIEFGGHGVRHRLPNARRHSHA